MTARRQVNISRIGEGTRGMITRKEYDKLNAFNRGYAVYWQAELPGSELAGLRNPYPINSRSWGEFERGQLQACLDAQDSEE